MSMLGDKLRQLKQAQDSIESLEALLEIVKAMYIASPQRLFELAVEKAIELTGADRGCFISIQDGRYFLEIARERQAVLTEFQFSRTVVREVVDRRAALVLTDIHDEDGFAAQASIAQLAIRMALAAPVVIDGVAAGVLYVDSSAPKPGGFSESRLGALQALAEQAAVALRQARLHELLQAVDAAKLDFIKIASHELRTPAALMRGYAAMMAATPNLPAELLPLVEGVQVGVGRIGQIVDTMIDVGAIDQGQLEISPAPYSLKALASQAAQHWQTALIERNLQLEFSFEVPPDDAVIWPVDVQYMTTALRHLLQNAIKFTPDGGRITFRLARVRQGVQLAVADTGIGVDPGRRLAIFTKFYRVGDAHLHSTGLTKFMGAGPGLGLFLVQGIVRAHGGQVWVESNGGGSVFVGYNVTAKVRHEVAYISVATE